MPRLVCCATCGQDFSTFMRANETARCKHCGAVVVVQADSPNILLEAAVPAARGQSPAHYPSPVTREQLPVHDQEPGTREVPVEFHGSAAEFFRIWIVNVALSVVTLGIYSAWAKVRTRRYFYGNTRIDGAAFDYLANPIAILKGRIIAAVVLGLVGLTAQVSMFAYAALLVALFLISPWIIVRALQFNARVSVFRNVRFDFTRTVGEAYRIFVGWTLLVPFTLGFLIPFVRARTMSFMFSGHRFGNKSFKDQLDTAAVYGVYFKALGILLLIGIAGGLVGFCAMTAAPNPFAESAAESEPSTSVLLTILIPSYAIWIACFVFLGSFVTARVTNLLLNSGSVGDAVSFRSNLTTGRLFGIQLGYGFLTLVSLGLAYPWLRVRLAQYRAACTTVRLRKPLDDVVEEAAPPSSAAADQIGEALDIDLGF